MDSSNFRHRVLHKLAEELDLPKLTFQVIRRTMATLGKTKGHVKDIQGMMRHSKASTTTDVYMQSLEPEVRTAINAIHDELMGNGTTGPAPQTPSGTPAAPRVEEQRPVPQRAQTTKEAGSEHGDTPGRKPVRGVVLEFATRMRQSSGKEVALNA